VPESEPCVAAVRNYVLALKNKGVPALVTFYTFHSYSQLWMTPWGYTNAKRPPNFEKMVKIKQTCIYLLALQQ
jgi:hypothetical protein